MGGPGGDGFDPTPTKFLKQKKYPKQFAPISLSLNAPHLNPSPLCGRRKTNSNLHYVAPAKAGAQRRCFFEVAFEVAFDSNPFLRRQCCKTENGKESLVVCSAASFRRFPIFCLAALGTRRAT